MSKVSVSVDVEKELYEVAVLLCSLVTQIATKVPLADIVSKDLPLLEAAISGLGQIPAEFNEDIAALQKSFMLPIADMIASLVVKRS